MINFEETELRLGLPGGGGSGNETHESALKNTGKRGFSQTSVDLKLNLSSSNNDLPSVVAKDKNSTSTTPAPPRANVDPAKPPSK